jgi:hypothetical protein
MGDYQGTREKIRSFRDENFKLEVWTRKDRVSHQARKSVGLGMQKGETRVT